MSLSRYGGKNHSRASKSGKLQRSREDELPTFLRRLMEACGKQELLSVRVTCSKRPALALVGAVNREAAALAVQCANRALRNTFDIVERRLCHHTSFWRRGFSTVSNGGPEATFWICRGICQTIKRSLPLEVELVLSSFCNNPFFNPVCIGSRQMTNLNSLGFHWHRNFSQGASGPWKAVNLAQRTLSSSAACILELSAGMRCKERNCVDEEGQEITKAVDEDIRVVQTALNMLAEARMVMQAHPQMFGQSRRDDKAEDQAQKDENHKEKLRIERLAQLGYYVDEDRDARY